MVEASEAIGDYFERFALFTHTYYIACLNSVGGNVNDFAVDSDMLVEHELTGCGTGFCDAKAVYHIIEAAFEERCGQIAAVRPTAVNLSWAVSRCAAAVKSALAAGRPCTSP